MSVSRMIPQYQTSFQLITVFFCCICHLPAHHAVSSLREVTLPYIFRYLLDHNASWTQAGKVLMNAVDLTLVQFY